MTAIRRARVAPVTSACGDVTDTRRAPGAPVTNACSAGAATFNAVHVTVPTAKQTTALATSERGNTYKSKTFHVPRQKATVSSPTHTTLQTTSRQSGARPPPRTPTPACPTSVRVVDGSGFFSSLSPIVAVP